MRGFPGSLVVKNTPANAREHRRYGFNPKVRKIPWRRKWQPAPVFLPGQSRGQRSLTGRRPWVASKLGTTEQLRTEVFPRTTTRDLELLLDSHMLTMLTRQQVAAESSVQLKKNVSFCSIRSCTVRRDCTEQTSGLVRDFWSFRGLQL